MHDDEDDVLILCLEGEMSYVIEDRKPVTLKSGDTIGGYVRLPRDCLLYTSPSPRDVEDSRMPE